MRKHDVGNIAKEKIGSEKITKTLLFKGRKNENGDLNKKKTDNAEKCEDAKSIIRAYDEIARTKKEHHMHCL